jgi:hypothetical protein
MKSLVADTPGFRKRHQLLLRGEFLPAESGPIAASADATRPGEPVQGFRILDQDAMPRGVGRPSGKQIEQHSIVRLVPEIDMATPSP